MKRHLTLIYVMLFVLMSVGAHSALTNFKYTGIAFDGSGNILAGTTVDVQIDLIDGGTPYFSEKHTAVQTDQFGAYTVEVGTGTLLSGSLGSVTVTKTLKIKSTVTSGGSGGVWVVSSLIKTNLAVTALNTASEYFWSLSGNAGTTSGTNFIGTTDNTPLELRVADNSGTYLNKLIIGTNNEIYRDGSSSSVPGNPRGANAVDLQSRRNNVSQVASGDYSTIGGGRNNIASKDYSTVAGGRSNIASGEYSTVSGGRNNEASGDYSTIPGGEAALADKYGQFSFASGSFANKGDAQTSVFVLRNETNDASTVQLYPDGSSQSLTIPSNTTWSYRIMLVARSANGLANAGGWEITGLIDRTALSTPSVTAINVPAGWSAPTVTLSGNNMIVQVTGVAATTIRWVARVELAEVGL